MENTFNSITQYDKSFDKMFKNISKKGYACSYFSILSCWRFIQTGLNGKEAHELNITDAMKITKILDLANGLSFEDLIIGCTSVDSKKIICTSVDLVANNIIGINNMFPNKVQRYAVMFLKSEKYFVVLVDNNNYYIRDCHVDVQHNFKSLDQLYLHLINFYQFTENINVSGIEFDEYSSIEFLIFDNLFETDVISLLSMKPKKHNSDYFTNFNNDFEHDIDDIVDKVLNYDLHKDIFELPEKIMLTDEDIEYLDTLCNSKNKIVNLHEIEQFSVDEFSKISNNLHHHDDLVDF